MNALFVLQFVGTQADRNELSVKEIIKKLSAQFKAFFKSLIEKTLR